MGKIQNNKTVIKTGIPGPKSKRLVKKALKSIAKAQYAGLFGIVLSSGKGSYITDVDGNTFLDFLTGASVVGVGYGRSDVIESFAKEAKKLQHSCFPYSPNEEAVKLAEKMIKITPGKFDKKVLFGLSGSDSVDAAIKIARKYTKKPRIISFKNAYHGQTGLSIQANGFPGLQEGFFLGKDFNLVNFPSNNKKMEKSLDKIKKILKKGNVAGLVTEVIQGDGGNIVPPIGFHKELVNLLHKYKALYIVDEVQSGFGRSGKWWEIEHFGVEPDILCTAKGITSGYAPLSVCVARAEMAESLAKVQHLFTYSGHGPSCAAANKVIEIIENEKLLKNAKERGQQLTKGLQKLVQRYDCAVEVRGKGLHVGFEVIDNKTKRPLGGLFAFRCAEKGLYPGYFGPTNNVMRLHPTLIIGKREMKFAVDIISEVVEEWESGRFPKESQKSYAKFGVGLGTD